MKREAHYLLKVLKCNTCSLYLRFQYTHIHLHVSLNHFVYSWQMCITIFRICHNFKILNYQNTILYSPTHVLGCPSSEWVKLSTACYYIHTSSGLNYRDALKFCHEKHPGAYLAMVETQREQKQLAKYLQGVTKSGEFTFSGYTNNALFL